MQTDLQGEARDAVKVICNQFKDYNSRTFTPQLFNHGGETTVTVHGQGHGGRNQEFALASVMELTDMENVMIIALATDGEDGPTDAAGAIVTERTYAKGRAIGLSPQSFLQENTFSII